MRVCPAWLDLGGTGMLTSDSMTPHPKAFCWDLSGPCALSKNGNCETSLEGRDPSLPLRRTADECLGLVKCMEDPSADVFPGFRDLLPQASLLWGLGSIASWDGVRAS